MTPQLATFAAGCFWGVEERFRTTPGVLATTVGYTGGHTEKPTYQQVCTDTTGHAEVVQVQFDPQTISYDALLEVFFACHDPTQVNRQGPDVGRQYRSAIFVQDDAQRQAAEAKIASLQASGRFRRSIATIVEPAATFWPAEEYHQQYLAKRGQSACGLH